MRRLGSVRHRQPHNALKKCGGEIVCPPRHPYTRRYHVLEKRVDVGIPGVVGEIDIFAYNIRKMSGGTVAY